MNTLHSTHWSFFRRTLGAFCALAAASVMFAQPTDQPANPTGSEITGRDITGSLVRSGAVNLRQIAAANKLKPLNTTGPELNWTKPRLRPPRPNPNPQLSTAVATNGFTAPSPDITGFGLFTGFNGLNHFQQRNSNGGNQFSLEPPDQALAVGNGFILEGVNDAFNIYNTAGVPQLAAPIAATQFFNLPATIVRPDGPFGPFMSDPVALFDSSTQRFFVIMASIETNPVTGEFLAQTRLHIAVSQSADPTGAWTVFLLDSTDANNPDGQGSRLPDYEKIGVDQNGFYISSNEFQLGPNENFGNYIGASIRAISKSALEEVNRIAPPPVVEIELRFNAAASATRFNFTILPAKTPPGQAFSQLRGGLEYFVSSDAIDFNGNEVAVWTLFNTASLNTSTPQLHLAQFVVLAGLYSSPTVGVEQKPGPLPLGTALLGPNPPLPLLDPGDVRMLSLDFADGRLWGTLDTQVLDSHKNPRMAADFIILQPTTTNPSAFTLVAHRIISKDGASLLRSAVGTNKFGTLVGPNNFPSAALTPFNGLTIGPVTITQNGFRPEDGFTGYPPDQTPPFNTARWGDYSFTAVSDSDQKSVWVATEYIGPLPRTVNANWSTRITKYITP